MNENKLSVIAKTYGDIWDKIKDNVDHNGWVSRKIIGHGETNGMEYSNFGYSIETIELRASYGNYDWRPKILKGIESNNGWSRTDELMPEPGQRLIITQSTATGYTYRQGFDYEKSDESFFKKTVVHWRYAPLPPPDPFY